MTFGIRSPLVRLGGNIGGETGDVYGDFVVAVKLMAVRERCRG